MLKKKKEFHSSVIQTSWEGEGERERKSHPSLSSTTLSQLHAMETHSTIGNKFSVWKQIFATQERMLKPKERRKHSSFQSSTVAGSTRAETAKQLSVEMAE